MTGPGTDRWDLLVVGGGTAGIVGAKTAARLGARVLLVERDRTGGDCLWTGCVPSKALLAAADAAAGARGATRLGVGVDAVRVDFAEVMAHVRRAIDHIAPVDSPAALEAAGVTVVHGDLRFTGPTTARVGEGTIEFTQALVCTGSAPAVPPIPGLSELGFLTSDTVWELDRLPDNLVVLGGGSIGCELGQGFARLGARVTLVEGADRLLPREDPEAAAAVRRVLEAEGIDVLTAAKVISVRAGRADDGGVHRPDGERPGAGRLELADGRTVAFDRLLVGVGRTPRTSELGLDEAGVAVDEHGFVRVDRHLRTTNPRLWAAGDLTGHPQFTHVAGVHGSLAAGNAVLGVRRSVDTTSVPRVTYTQPEVAAVGVRTDAPPGGLRVLRRSHEHVDRAVTEGLTGGLTKLTVDRRGRILGATVVGPRAGETLGELTLAVRHGLRTRDLAGTTHAYPTWNDGAWHAAIADLRVQLERPATHRALRSLAGARRWWLARQPPSRLPEHESLSDQPRQHAGRRSVR